MMSISKRCEYLPGGWSELFSRAADFKNYIPNNKGSGVELFTGQNSWLCVRSILNNTIESLGVILVMRINLTAGVAYIVSNIVSNLSYNIPNRESMCTAADGCHVCIISESAVRPLRPPGCVTCAHAAQSCPSRP